LKLLNACATAPQVISGASTAPRHHLESTGLICRVNAQLVSEDPTYIATEKGVRALRVQNIMKELGIMRQRRPLARFPDNDLVRLLVLLENMTSEHQRVQCGSGAQHS
jgi:hypothetical protein